jgi:hypothetical protein
MSDTILNHLIAAKALISDPAHWTRAYYAKKKNGEACEAWDNDAVCWCSYGALRKTAGLRHSGDMSDDYYTAENVLYDAAGPHGVVEINDTQNHADVMAMFDRAIEAERTKNNDLRTST